MRMSSTENADPCAAGSAGEYDLPLHIAAVFVVLVASFIGAALPMVNKHFFDGPAGTFVITIGKCTGTGVVLACALIHMLQPSNESLTSPCVPASIAEFPFAFLFAMLAALTMQFIESMAKLTPVEPAASTRSVCF